MKNFHMWLRRYRVLQILIISHLTYTTWVFTEWMTATPYVDLKDWHLAPVTAAFPALVGGLLAIANSVVKRFEKDEHDQD